MNSSHNLRDRANKVQGKYELSEENPASLRASFGAVVPHSIESLSSEMDESDLRGIDQEVRLDRGGYGFVDQIFIDRPVYPRMVVT